MDDLTDIDEPVETPVVVPVSAAPQLVSTLVRYALVALGGYLLTNGLASESTRDLLLKPEVINGVVVALLTVVPTAIGLLRSKRNVAVQQTLESKLPNSVAIRG